MGECVMTNNKRVKKREEIDPKYKWNIEDMYSNEEEWIKDCSRAEELADIFTSFSGRLSESAQVLLEALQARDSLWLMVEKAYVYARMKKDEDTRVSQYQALSDKAQSLIAKTAAKTSFFTPELLEMPEEKLLGFLTESEGLKLYEHVIREILRLKAHVLSKTEEKLIAQFSEITSATNDIFSMINNADIKFGTIIDEEGDEVEVTHGRYISLMESQDRRVRKEAFEHMYAAYEAQKNTLAATYNYNTKTDVVNSRIRKYGSSLEAALSGDNIPEEVYNNLISTVNKNLPLIHRYMEIRRRTLGLDAVHMYDLYTPLFECPIAEIPYENALEIISEGLAPLGEDYIFNMKKGLAEGWIDVFENEGKTSGAYSFGSYNSMPYILLNYNGRLKDVFTIAHEMGHSMHSYYTRKNQPFVYGGHSIFTAEVASTVNENLLMNYLLKKEKDLTRRKYLLNLYLEEFRATLFRQTMFAEFEKMTHQAVEEGEVLTSEWLCENYLDLNRKYFGENVYYDPEIAMEWSRIPHFYNAFYVYKYATGYSAAVALSNRILREGIEAKNAYLTFLKSGESNYPIELLKLAGVDMSIPDPIEKAMNTFEKLIDDLEKVI
jgi:oligoendopeptidase F